MGSVYAGSGGALVRYSPQSQPVSATLPSISSYTLSITPPAAYTSFPVTVNLRVVATSFPLGDAATAQSYIQLSSPTLTFTSATDTESVVVTMNMPLTALSNEVPAGGYMYAIYTDGWVSPFVDGGATINAGMSLPIGSDVGSPPTVSITSPADGSTINTSYTNLPLTVSFAFTATSSDSNAITTVTADLDGAAITLDSPIGLNTTSVSATGSMIVTTPGTHTLHAWATSADGSSSDASTFTVQVGYPPPTVAITTPTPGTLYTYRFGSPATVVPLSFVGTSTFGVITQLTATLDGTQPIVFAVSGLNTASATATAQLPFSASGQHQVQVTATDQYGQVVSADTNFTINEVDPSPAVVINGPTPNQVFTVPVGATTAVVAYQFTTTVLNGFNVDSVSGALGSTVLTPTTTGLGSPTATSTGTLNLPVGSYTLTAVGGSSGVTATASVSFVVKSAAVPPSVVINSPIVGYTQAIVPGATASVPLVFVGTSNNPGGVITSLGATLDGVSVQVTSNTIGQVSATGSATLPVTAAGTHHIVVVANDATGSATATRDFTITYLTSHQISGTVFFDLDGNGTQNGSDFGLSTVAVKLLGASGQTLATTTTNAAGMFTFKGLYAGSYTIVASAYPGMVATTPSRQSITVASADVVATPIGFKLDFCGLEQMTADGRSMGFWKTNISKAIAGKTSGVQVSAAKLSQYTAALAQFALTQFDGLTMKQALATMSSTSCSPASLLAKQLLPAEYNYENGAYINGNPTLTFAFVAWGESVLQNSSSYSSDYLQWAADWFEAYNTSEGGSLSGPGSFGKSGCGSCSGGDDRDGGDSHGDHSCDGGRNDDSSHGGCSWGGHDDDSSHGGCSWGGGHDDDSSHGGCSWDGGHDDGSSHGGSSWGDGRRDD